MPKSRGYNLYTSWLITGGCGFIGTNLIVRLIKHSNCKIRVVDNLTVGTKDNLGSVCDFVETEKPLKGSNRVELWVGDIKDADLALKAAQGMECIIHLAANSGVIPSIEDPRNDCEANVIGTFNYLEAARQHGVKKFVFASSGAPLGEQTPPISENNVPKPISPYGASKLAGEGYCSAYYGSFRLSTTALRFGNVYGQRSTHKGSVIAKFIKQVLNGEPLTIYGDGNQTRDFIYVEDLIEAIILASAKPGIGGEVFQIATHKEHTIMEVACELNQLAKRCLGYESSIIFEKERAGEVRRSYSDISKAKKLLDFEPKYDLKQGLEATVTWFLGEYINRKKTLKEEQHQ